jgi:rhodanese-related sulfurtransferase
MRKLFSLLFASFLFLSFSACAAPASPAEPTPSPKPAEYHKISASDAKARLDSGDTLILLDVRTKEEFDAGHIAGAVLLPNETIVDTPPEALPDLNAEILIYCRSGNRSAQAAKKLVAMGYTNVYDFGGIIDWPYEVVTD